VGAGIVGGVVVGLELGWGGGGGGGGGVCNVWVFW